MKKRLLSIAFIAFALSGCIKNLTNINKEIDYSQDFSVDGIPDGTTTLPQGGITASFPTISFATNAQDYIKQYNTSSDKIVSVKLAKFNLTMLQPANGNFDYVDTVRIYLGATGMSEKLAAYKYGIAKGQNTISLDKSSDEFKEYFLQDSMSIRISAHFIAVPDSNSKIHMETGFNMVANPLN